MKPEIEKIHTFESAGLGKAPFRVLGYEYKTFQACPGAPIQPGGSCAYCGQGIVNIFKIESADGVRSNIGPDCIRKTGDAGLRKVVDAQVREAARQARMKKAVQVSAELTELLAVPEIREALARQDHPRKSWGVMFEQLTRLDYIAWCMDNGGASGRAKILKALKAEFPVKGEF
jgi:hypothetical protein